MDTRVLEILNQMVIIIIYAVILSREFYSNNFDMLNSIMTIGGIILSVSMMLFIWYLKER